MTQQTILEINNVFKSFQVGAAMVEILKGITATVQSGDFLILFGPSGCGKSTMLNILLGLEPPTNGTVKFLGDDLYRHDEDGRAVIRKEKVGMVYQQSNWVKSLSVIENVYFPLTLMGKPMKEREERAMQMLKQVNMEQTAHQAPTELSSGQQQRVALARALITDPALIVADEPTGNLDSISGEQVMQLFKDLNTSGRTVIMVTHDLEYITYATRAIHMSDGVVKGEYSAEDGKLKEFMHSKKGSVMKTVTNAET